MQEPKTRKPLKSSLTIDINFNDLLKDDDKVDLDDMLDSIIGDRRKSNKFINN